MKKTTRKERIIAIIANYCKDFSDEKFLQSLSLISSKYKAYKELLNSAEAFPSIHSKHIEYVSKSEDAFEEMRRAIEEARKEGYEIIGKRKAKKDYFNEYCSFIYNSIDITALISL